MTGDELPTRTDIHKARKAELQTWCQEWGLDDAGTVAELRERLLDHLDEMEELEEELEGEEEVEVEEEYQVKAKPTLDPAQAELLALRDRIRRRRPTFRRQEGFRYGRLGEGWRRPRGRHSKLRRRLRYRGAVPSAGYRGPQGARDVHPSGFREVLVHRPEDLEAVDPQVQAVRIAHSVGTRKRLAIQDRADELEIRVLNRVVE